MDKEIETDVKRFLSYGWKSKIIINIIRRKHGVKLTKNMINLLVGRPLAVPNVMEDPHDGSGV